MELRLDQHQAGICNLLELTPTLQHFTTSSQKSAEIQADLVETVDMAFHHLKGPGNREPPLTRVQQNQRGCGSGLLLWEKQGKEGEVVRGANRVFMYNTPRAISNFFLCMAALSHFGKHFQSMLGIVRSLESAGLGERL